MISIIMAIYNSEHFLEKTLASVKAQTYKDFELIMIDDGSSDSSGVICDKWAQEDTRFKAFHFKNGGLSQARNRGLELASGDYIYIMDSDDLIEPDTLEDMFNTAKEQDADIVMGNLNYVDAQLNSIDKLNNSSPVKNEVLTDIMFLEKLTQLTANYYCIATNKLYKAEIIKNIRYPIGKIHEDEHVIHHVVFGCKKIVTLEKRYYKYIKHENSITGAEFSPKSLDRENAYIERIRFLKENDLDNIASATAMTALDSETVRFAKCVKSGYFYGNTKKALLDAIKFFIKNAPPLSKIKGHNIRVYLVSCFILKFPDIYAKYIEFFAKKETAGTGEAVKELVFDLILKCFSILPTKNRIIFESHPEMSCNTYPVYKYLLEKGLNEKYEFVWLSENPSNHCEAYYKNTSFIPYTKSAKSFIDKIKTMYYIATAKALVYSNQLLGEHGKNKLSLCLQHGMPLKKSNGTYCIKNDCTAAVCVSEFFAENYNTDFRVEKDKMIFTGFPRNDLLLTDNDSKKKLGLEDYDKIIFWLPTFRQRKDKKLGQYEMDVKGTGIPAIDTAEEMAQVNEFLKANNCLLILKPHPVQDMSAMKESGLSHIRIINDGDLKAKDIQLYELLGKCDAMITDYSSVFYDYLLTDKPIGLTIGDIDEYIAKRGFVYKNPLDILKGEYIYDTNGLITFLANVKNDNDIAQAERTEVKNTVHSIQEPISAELVGNYIISKIDKL